MFGTVRQLTTYPIKGCAGIAMPRAMITPAGLVQDRSFMVISPDGVFRSQRRDPRLAVIRPQVSPDSRWLTLRAPGAPTSSEPVHLDGPRRDVQLFGTDYQGIDQGDPIARWLTDVLTVPSRLVRVPPEHGRVTDGQIPGTSGYADSCAVHLIAQSSLDLLNQRIAERGGEPLPMSRFRPNIVVADWPRPHTEDQVREFAVGAAELGFAKLAIRCVVTTIDQDSGDRMGPEVLRTLAGYRREREGLAFGVKFAVLRPGEVGIGDRVVVSRWAE